MWRHLIYLESVLGVLLRFLAIRKEQFSLVPEVMVTFSAIRRILGDSEQCWEGVTGQGVGG